MNAKQAPFEILGSMRSGERFSGIALMERVRDLTGEAHYPDTTLRYMREYRAAGREIRNVDKRRSIYEVCRV